MTKKNKRFDNVDMLKDNRYRYTNPANDMIEALIDMGVVTQGYIDEVIKQSTPNYGRLN